MRSYLVLFVTLTFVAFGEAQTTPRLVWGQEGENLTEVQSFIYKSYLDSAVQAVVINGVTCSGAVSPFTCSTPLPSFPPGRHTLQLTATTADGIFESVKSSPLGFGLGAPTNLRIVS